MNKTMPILAAVLLMSGLAAVAPAKVCKDCAGKANILSVGKCSECGQMTASGAAKLCPNCSEKLGQCEMCRKPLALAEAKEGKDKPPQPAGRLAKAGSQISGINRNRALKAKAPESGLIDSAATLRGLLKDWGYKDPDWTTDFSKNIVLVATADGPNRVRVSAKLKDGDLKVLGMATRMAGPGFGWAMLVHTREGVRTVDGKPLPEPPKPAPGPITIGEDRDGKTVEMSVGQELIVRLKGNATTGFEWTVATLKGDALKEIGEVAYEPEKTGMVGSGGVYVARFRALKPGQAKLVMRYARPWAGPGEGEKAKACTVAVTVAPAAKGEVVRIVNQWQGPRGTRRAGSQVIRTEKEFRAAWKDRGRGPAPKVDFTKHCVLLVDMGGKPTGGYSVKITSVVKHGNDLLAYVQHTSPGPDDMVTQALTAPWCMAEIAAARGEVTFTQIKPAPADQKRGGTPETQATTGPHAKMPAHSVIIDIWPNGRIEIQGQSVVYTKEDLPKGLAKLKDAEPEALVLRPTGRTKWQDVVDVYSACIKAGFRDISFAQTD